MSGSPEVGSTPEFLQSAAEYRDHLMAELAKVDEFIRVAVKHPASDTPEAPDFLLVGSHDLLDILTPTGMMH